jgi:hypothetical protein
MVDDAAHTQRDAANAKAWKYVQQSLSGSPQKDRALLDGRTHTRSPFFQTRWSLHRLQFIFPSASISPLYTSEQPRQMPQTGPEHRMLDSSLWTPIEWPVELQPMLVVAVDTEAEFDWASSTSRRAAGVRSIERLTEVQDIFNRYNVRPTLVLDYPVSSTPESYKRVRGLFLAGNCEIGAHLQPWDTPPFLEETTDRNSYPGNLPPELEREKLSQLTEAIHLNIGVKPRVYKAGRYIY